MIAPSNDSNSLSLRDIYLRATEKKTPEARDAFLEGACGENLSLRDKVEALLRENEEDSFLEAPAIEKGETEEDGSQEALGTLIGRYKILQSIGEGGFGTVYMAEQKEPVKRRVALKIIKLGMDTKQVVARFEAERQALAMMDHPNIAKVFDAGATEAGRPYFVMELVRGISIIKYCDENNLNAQERLHLFMEVCLAIQHAHQKGVIHRDIKPSNIMITLHDGEPVPKVIDFGIAKATQQELTEKTLFSQYSQFIGTPAYMSPEQAEMSGLDVDTRSDIYSLGVLLYELLTGQTPLDRDELMSGGYDEIRRRIREGEPSKPSTRVSTMVGEERTKIAKQRNVDAAKLSHFLQGDLDWVVMKSLEKDRTRRYETANALRLDVQRFLADEPVTAIAPSARYLLGKYIRRHRTVVSFAAAIAVLLVVATTVSSFFAIAAGNAKRSETQLKEEALVGQAETEVALHEAEHQKGLADNLANQLRHQIYEINMSRANAAVQEMDGYQANLYLQECDETLRGWEWRHLNLVSTSFTRTVYEGNRGVANFEISPDGTRMVVDQLQGDPIVVDSVSGELISSSELSLKDNFSKSRWHPEKPWIATTDLGAIQLWGPNGMRRTIRGEFGDIERIVFGFGGSQLVLPHYFSPSGAVSIWNVDSGERVEEIPTGFLSSPTVRPCLSPDGKWLAALARKEGTICIWDRDNLNSAKLPLTLPYSDHGSGMSLTFSPDGHQLIAGFSDGTILGFDVENSWSRFDVDQVPGIWGGRATSGIFDLAFSPNGAVLAATANNSVLLYAVPSYRPLMQLLGCEGVVSSVQFHPKGDRLFVGDLLGNIYTWDFQYASGSLSLPGHAGELRELQFSPNGEWLATTGSSDGTVKIWNVKTGDLVRALGKDISGPEMEFTAPAALDFSPDGKLLAIADWKGPVTSLVDVSTGRRIQRLEGFERMGFVDFHPAGNHLAGCSSSGQVIIWSLGDEKPPVTLDFKTLPLWQRALDLGGGVSLGGIAYSPNGNILAVSVNDGPVAILDGKTGQIVNESPFTSETVCRRDIAFSPTEPLIAAGAKDGKLTLWRYQSDEAPKLLTGHQLGIRSLDFSPDGTRLVSGGDDGRLLIWNMETERVMMDLAMEVNTMWGVDFSPDGKSIAVTGDEGKIHILESEPVSDEIARRRLEVALNRD